MTFARWSLSLITAIGVLAGTVAIALVWLFLTDPVTVADTGNRALQGDPMPLLQAIGTVIYHALSGLFKYL